MGPLAVAQTQRACSIMRWYVVCCKSKILTKRQICQLHCIQWHFRSPFVVPKVVRARSFGAISDDKVTIMQSSCMLATNVISLWPSYAIWSHKYGTTLADGTKPSLESVITDHQMCSVVFTSPDSDFTRPAHVFQICMWFNGHNGYF